MSARPPEAPDRGRLIGQAHAAARDLGLDEATRRELQARVTGRGSCREMSAGELASLLDHYRGLGWRPRGADAPRRRDRLPADPVSPKLRALWIAGWHLGVVRDRSEGALLAFVRREGRLDAARFATPAHLSRAVEALKLWLARPAAEGGGGVDWSPYERVAGPPLFRPRARVIEAQWRRLRDLGAEPDVPDLRLNGTTAFLVAVEPGVFLSDADADALIRALGTRIRGAARSGGDGG